MSSGKEILIQAESEVKKLFKEKVDKGYTYHNIQHTMKVFEAVNEIATESGLSESNWQLYFTIRDLLMVLPGMKKEVQQ